MLQLKKPLAFIDLETTGINLGKDRILEIAIVKVLVDGTKSIKRKLINPEMPIPKTSPSGILLFKMPKSTEALVVT